MKLDKSDIGSEQQELKKTRPKPKAGELLKSNIGDSIDVLVEYLVDNNVTGIHPLDYARSRKKVNYKSPSTKSGK